MHLQDLADVLLEDTGHLLYACIQNAETSVDHHLCLSQSTNDVSKSQQRFVDCTSLQDSIDQWISGNKAACNFHKG